jgi:phosphatidate phosphatase APP1
MPSWQDVIVHVAANVEEHYDALKLRLRERLGIGPVQILPYLGHGTRHFLVLRGRAVADYKVEDAQDNDTIWQNLLNMYRRFNSHEIPYARVRAVFGEIEQEVTANEEGHFEVRLELDAPLPTDTLWFHVELELVDYLDQEGARAVGDVLVPPPEAQFGVISDLDDTVIQTDITNWLKLARNAFLRNAHTRLPFAGVAEFYLALQQGTTATYNPIYYVSNGPWNIYDLLIDFFTVRQIPLGPLFLTDLGTTEDHLIRADPLEHKLTAIESILDTHPELPFILIGDSGEQDPEIYLQAVQRRPGRILAVYIRDVSGDVRDTDIQLIIEKMREAGTDMLLVPDTVAAAVHAAEHGWIDPDALPAIRQEKRTDQQEPGPVEKLIDAMP